MLRGNCVIRGCVNGMCDKRSVSVSRDIRDKGACLTWGYVEMIRHNSMC